VLRYTTLMDLTQFIC